MINARSVRRIALPKDWPSIKSVPSAASAAPSVAKRLDQLLNSAQVTALGIPTMPTQNNPCAVRLSGVDRHRRIPRPAPFWDHRRSRATLAPDDDAINAVSALSD
jgi:hypothetical protein